MFFSEATEMWRVELTLTNEADGQRKALAEHLKKEIGEKPTIWTLGSFLTKIGQYEQAEDYYRRLQHIVPGPGQDNRATIFNRIAYTKYKRGDHFAARDCLEIAMNDALEDGEVAVVTEYNQKMVIAEASLAILCAPSLRHRLEDHQVTVKYLLSDFTSKSIIQNNFGCVYQRLGDVNRALKYYENALQILLKHELSFLSEISAIYNNIGSVQHNRENYDGAAKNFDLAMTTLSKLDPDHPWMSEYIKNLQAAQDCFNSNKTKRPRTE
jgi:tetratricopeptide (TPR) repeat protein